MKRNKPHILEMPTLSALMAIAVTIGALSLQSPPAAAHPPDTEEAAEHVSANDAKRIVRRFLTERGFSRSVGSGGATVNKVRLRGNHWVVQVTLRHGSAASGRKQYLYVNTTSGLLSETAAPIQAVALREAPVEER